MIKKWIVYYEDGKSFSSDWGNPEDAPRRGVLVVVNEDKEVGRVIYHAGDFYVWNHDEWLPVDHYGFMDYLLEPGSYKVVLFGRMTTREKMHEAYKQAFEDTRLPAKTGFHESERPI